MFTERFFPKKTVAAPEMAPEAPQEDHFNSVRIVQMGDLVEDLKPAGYVGILKMLDLPNFKLPTKIYEDKMGGKFFQLKESQNLETQFFVSQTLKGFLPVCELVQVQQEDGTKKFFSYVPPQKDFVEKEFDQEKALADNMILHLVMGDMDHSVYGTKNNQSIIKGNFLLWDFDYSAGGFWTRHGFEEKEYMRRIEEMLPRSIDRPIMYQDMLLVLEKMEDFYSSNEGEEMLEALYKKSGVKDMNELFLKPKEPYSSEGVDYNLEDWRLEVLKRVGVLKALCFEKIGTSTAKAA